MWKAREVREAQTLDCVEAVDDGVVHVAVDREIDITEPVLEGMVPGSRVDLNLGAVDGDF